MKLNKIIPLSLAGCLALGVYTYTYPNISADAEIISPILISQKEAYNAPVKITVKEINTETEAYKLKLRIPMIEGLKDLDFQKQLNDKIMNKAMQDKENLEQQGNDFAAECKKQGWEVRPLGLFIDYSVASNDDILSFSVTSYEETGGTGLPLIDYYNIDVEACKQLELKDLFKAKVDYKEIINKEVKEQIKTQMEAGDSMYFEGEIGFKSIANNQGFYIKNGNLVICFDKYEIAAGAAGTPEFEILGAKLEGYLQKDFTFDEIIVSTKEIQSYNEAYVNMQIPVIEDIKNVTYEKQLNQIIMNHATQTKELVEKEAKLHAKSAEESNIPFKPYELRLDYNVTAKNGIVSLTITTTTNTYTELGEVTKTDCYTIDTNKEVKYLFDQFDLIVNGKSLNLSENKVFLTNQEIVMVPLRNVAEALGYQVQWNNKYNQVELTTANGSQASVKIGADQYTYYEEFIFNGATPEEVEGTSYVPLSFVSNELKADVKLDTSGTILITQD